MIPKSKLKLWDHTILETFICHTVDDFLHLMKKYPHIPVIENWDFDALIIGTDQYMIKHEPWLDESINIHNDLLIADQKADAECDMAEAQREEDFDLGSACALNPETCEACQ